MPISFGRMSIRRFDGPEGGTPGLNGRSSSSTGPADQPHAQNQCVVYWGYIGMMEKKMKMETTITCWGHIGIVLERSAQIGRERRQ